MEMLQKADDARQEHDEDASRRDLFIRQVEDHALSAPQILTLQRDGREPDQPIRVFIP